MLTDYRNIPAEIRSSRNIVFIILFLFSPVCTITASTIDSIYSVYRNGEFETRYQSRAKVSKDVVSDVADYLVSDFHNSPEHLFSWALKDLGLQNKNNEVIIVPKSSAFNAKTGMIHGVFDINVPHFRTFKDVSVDALITKTRYTNGAIKLKADIVYSSLLLDKAVGTITLYPQKNNNLVAVANADISFGWFFNLFITQKRYKSIVEWRIKKLTENVIDECERRYHVESKK